MDTTSIAVAVLAALSAGCLAYALIYPYLSGDIRGERRQAAVAKSGTRRSIGERGIDVAVRRKQIGESLKELEAKQKERSRVTLEMRIAQAGLTWTKQRYYVTGVVLALVLALTLYIASGGLPAMAGLGLIIGGFGLPPWTLTFLRKRRIARFIEAFPDAMDVIVRGIKSGLPLGDCMRIIANESQEPVKSEFRQIVETQTLGVPMGEACGMLFSRIPVSEANFFGIVIEIQQKAGGNLSEAIGNLSRVLRERKKMKGKISAMSMEAKASAAIIASLPFIVGVMVYFSSPRYIELLWLTQTGKLVMGACALWMIIGISVMRKMINFDM